MDVSQLKKIRTVGKLEEIAAVAHELNLYTNSGYSVHYKTSQVSLIPDLQPLIYLAVAEVLREHPTLFAVPIVANDKEPYLARLPSIDLRKVISFVQRQEPILEDGKGRDLELDALLQDQVNTNFKSEHGIIPAWRLIILYDFAGKHQFTANFMSHHTITDGASFQIFHRSFHKALHALTSSFATKSLEIKVENIILSNDNDGIAPSLESIHPLPIPDELPKADATIYNYWLGNPTEVPSNTGYASLSLSPQLVESFTQECKKNKVAKPAGLNALIAKVLYSNLQSTIEAMEVNIPVDIRPDLPPKVVDGMMGNFFDAFRTKILRSDFFRQDSTDLTEIWNSARKVQADTRSYFSNTSPSGEAYLNIALLRNIPDLPALLSSMIGGPRTESLEVAYLGPYTPFSDVKPGNEPVWQAGKVTVSRCAYALGACLQVTVILHSEGMTIGFAWPKCAIEDDLIEKAIDGIRAYFEAIEEPLKDMGSRDHGRINVAPLAKGY